MRKPVVVFLSVLGLILLSLWLGVALGWLKTNWAHYGMVFGAYVLLLAGIWFKFFELKEALNTIETSHLKLETYFWILVLVAAVVRIPFLTAAPFSGDLTCFKSWALRMAETGPTGFYSEEIFCDYPPFSLYIYGVAGWIAKKFPVLLQEPFWNGWIKLPSLIFDLGTAFLILKLFKGKNLVLALFLSFSYLILPPVVYNSAYWGQSDSFYTFLVVLAFYHMVRRQPEKSIIWMAAAALTKAQTIAFIPVYLIYLGTNYPWRRLLKICGVGLVAAVMILLPFNLGKPVTWIFSHYLKQAVLYPYASVNAANLMTLWGGNYINDATRFFYQLSFKELGIFLFLGVSLWAGYGYWKKKNPASLATAYMLSALALFLFFPRMHERYLFPTLVFGWIAVGYYKDKQIYGILVLLSLGYLLNMHGVVLNYQQLMAKGDFDRSLLIVALINIGCFLGLFFMVQIRVWRLDYQSWRQFGRQYIKGYTEKFFGHVGKTSPFKPGLRDGLGIAIILLLYGILVFYRLGSWTTPQNGAYLSDWSDGVEVVFARPATLTTVVYYDGAEGGMLQLAAPGESDWAQIASLSCQDFYVLKRVSIAARTVERLRLIPQTSGWINEIAFLDDAGRLIPVQQVFSLQDSREIINHPLFDEPHSVLVNPSFLNSTYFDEIYHGRTAYEYLEGSSIYETTHPPLGKSVLSLGIKIFGMNPFGMRFMHACAGILLMLCLFFLGRQVLGSRFGAFTVMLMGCLDFMPFVQSRYATVDTTSTLFITLMFLTFFKLLQLLDQGRGWRSLLGTGALLMAWFGLATAVKWTAVYGFSGVLAGFLLYLGRQSFLRSDRLAAAAGESLSPLFSGLLGREWRNYRVKIALLGALLFCVALLAYYGSYIPYLQAQNIPRLFSVQAVREVLQNQWHMYRYHAGLTATHPYASSWWSWPFDFKPLWVYLGPSVKAGWRASIVSFGNPGLWYLMLVALLVFGFQWLKLRNFSRLHYALLGLLSLYLPWALVPRITFIYHFYPCLPLYYLFGAAFLEPLWEMKGVGWRLLGLAAILTAGAWLLYYPVLSGLDVPVKYIEFLRWFPQDWTF